MSTTISLPDYVGGSIPSQNAQLSLMNKAQQIQRDTTIELLEKTIHLSQTSFNLYTGNVVNTLA